MEFDFSPNILLATAIGYFTFLIIFWKMMLPTEYLTAGMKIAASVIMLPITFLVANFVLNK